MVGPNASEALATNETQRHDGSVNCQKSLARNGGNEHPAPSGQLLHHSRTPPPGRLILLMTTQSDPIVISDDDDNGKDDEILSVGSSDGSIELIEDRPPPSKPSVRTAQEKAAARSTTRLKPLSTFTEYRGSPSGSRHSKPPRQPNINAQLPTPERSPPRPLPRSSQQFLVETSPRHSFISERTSSTRPNKRSYVLEEGRGASAESNSRKRPRNVRMQTQIGRSESTHNRR